ncbi:TetR family transcriptional regulator [Desulfoluna limicola]|uniref:TetR family transcriptional regulator n=1 Tax=Desulfoluna limicola TaxID=2810562 RepID=A0ABM7PHT3_9BACT|nr:TetR/AcrR family transcriptional regulator [Desulfoluna limicola]BCS96695.1 TetR family transcriptional regulator [Desulfoluna limicola]
MDTKTKILDSAEKLIVELGADKASMRKITEEAGVNVAAINYHFGSKDNLISAIVTRFLTPLEEDQTTRLKKVMEKAGDEAPVLEDLLRSQLEPLYEFAVSNPDWMNVFHQFAAAYENEDFFKQNLKAILEKKLLYLADCMEMALPHLPRMSLLRRIAFFRLSAFGIMKGECIMEESIAILGIDSDPEAMLEELILYIASGLRAAPILP